MKSKKIQFIIVQLIIIVLINYLILFHEGFAFRNHWTGTFLFAMMFFHAGSFYTFYSTINSKLFSVEKFEYLSDLNGFIYVSFIFLLFFHNCLVKTENHTIDYFICLSMLYFSVIYLIKTRFSYVTFSQLKF